MRSRRVLPPRERPIKFFIDHCVPDSVGRVLLAAGHEVIFLRHQLAPNSPDPLVAAVAEMNEAVLISLDESDRVEMQRTAGSQPRCRCAITNHARMELGASAWRQADYHRDIKFGNSYTAMTRSLAGRSASMRSAISIDEGTEAGEVAWIRESVDHSMAG
jgi:predicted nuclease of predicted toxin-antitoxin system